MISVLALIGLLTAADAKAPPEARFDRFTVGGHQLEVFRGYGNAVSACPKGFNFDATTAAKASKGQLTILSETYAHTQLAPALWANEYVYWVAYPNGSEIVYAVSLEMHGCTVRETLDTSVALELRGTPDRSGVPVLRRRTRGQGCRGRMVQLDEVVRSRDSLRAQRRAAYGGIVGMVASGIRPTC